MRILGEKEWKNRRSSRNITLNFDDSKVGFSNFGDYMHMVVISNPGLESIEKKHFQIRSNSKVLSNG